MMAFRLAAIRIDHDQLVPQDTLKWLGISAEILAEAPKFACSGRCSYRLFRLANRVAVAAAGMRSRGTSDRKVFPPGWTG